MSSKPSSGRRSLCSSAGSRYLETFTRNFAAVSLESYYLQKKISNHFRNKMFTFKEEAGIFTWIIFRKGIPNAGTRRGPVIHRYDPDHVIRASCLQGWIIRDLGDGEKPRRADLLWARSQARRLGRLHYACNSETIDKTLDMTEVVNENVDVFDTTAVRSFPSYAVFSRPRNERLPPIYAVFSIFRIFPVRKWLELFMNFRGWELTRSLHQMERGNYPTLYAV